MKSCQRVWVSLIILGFLSVLFWVPSPHGKGIFSPSPPHKDWVCLGAGEQRGEVGGGSGWCPGATNKERE